MHYLMFKAKGDNITELDIKVTLSSINADIKQLLLNKPHYKIIISMAITSGQKTAFAILLVLTILLTGLHFAVAATGHQYFDNSNSHGVVLKTDDTNYTKRNFNQFAAFLIIAAGLTFLISLVLLIAFCADKFTPKVRHILATLNLILEFAIAVTVSLNASKTSNLKSYLQQPGKGGVEDNLQIYYRLLIADAVITFALEVLYLAVIYLGTLHEIENHVVLVPTVQNPPITAERLF